MDERELNAMLELDEYHWWYRGRRLILLAELSRLPLPSPARVLDAGCGSGRTLIELRRFGEASGIELSPQAADIARSRGGLEIKVGRLEELPWDEDTFDLVTCMDVIEHTPDDRVTLRELRRVCKPGGWLFVTVPAYQALWSPHDEVNHHYRRYVRPMLRAAAVEAGWQVNRMSSFNTLLLAPAAAVRVLQRYRYRSVDESYTTELKLGPPWLNRVLERPMRWEAGWLAKGHTFAAGLSLMAVFQNPGVQVDADGADHGNGLRSAGAAPRADATRR
jgi:SAM-dependent methyltransferase